MFAHTCLFDCLVFITLALGSNLGERRANLMAARHLLFPAFRETRASPIYETEPWGYADQPVFLNQILQGETNLPPHDLLVLCKQIEHQLGRVPTFRYGPRPIDVDILLYGDVLLDTPELTLPHARLHERAFVLVPLCDLDPQLLHPRLHQTMAQLLAQVDTTGVRPVPDSR